MYCSTKLPKDDPFASGSDVAALISPLKTNTLYDILQIETTATRSEIKRSYIALAKESHPDALLQNDRRFNEIARAYKILSDPTKQRRYDRELKAKGLSRSAGNMFENWVMDAAKAMDEALAKAESDLENGGRAKKSSQCDSWQCLEMKLSAFVRVMNVVVCIIVNIYEH
jgi:DnaJ-class molecular chaperone